MSVAVSEIPESEPNADWGMRIADCGPQIPALQHAVVQRRLQTALEVAGLRQANGIGFAMISQEPEV